MILSKKPDRNAVMFVQGKEGHFQFEGRGEGWFPGICAGGSWWGEWVLKPGVGM